MIDAPYTGADVRYDSAFSGDFFGVGAALAAGPPRARRPRPAVASATSALCRACRCVRNIRTSPRLPLHPAQPHVAASIPRRVRRSRAPRRAAA